MRGGVRKGRKREPKKTPTQVVTSETVSFPVTEESNVVPGSNTTIASQSSPCLLSSTPKRSRKRAAQSPEPCCTSTPVHRPSNNNLPSSPSELEIITRLKTKVESPCSKSKPQSKGKRGNASQPRQVRKSRTKKQTQTGSNANSPQAKCQPSKKRKADTRDLQKQSNRPRPRFELKTPDVEEKDEMELSSDLSIELSPDKEQLPSLSFQEEEEKESDEEELPSFLMQMDRKSLSISEGAFVWCKFRNYPFWPALVKSVNRKQKKASIFFIDDPKMQKKKGFSVALKTLKPFDCAEADELVCKAKEKYGAAIAWSLDLIGDYSIRIACGSFSGSFIDYLAHAMSYPVRRMYPQAASERLTITSDSVLEELGDDHKEDSFSEQQGEVSRSSKRLLPDRTHAAHNRANEKLVHFIVKQRMVEGHLLAVIRGQERSRWLHSFLRAKRRQVVNIYLEDDQQLDRVYRYLNELYASAVSTAPGLDKVKSTERVPFVLDVLLPEAIIHAIAGVDKLSLKKAEEKYMKGRCISNRERQEFDLMIEQEIRMKSQHQK